jgi:putative transposase
VAAPKKRAAQLGAVILFADETGLRLIPYIGKTWAKRGRDGTPAFRHHGHWTKVNLIAAISPGGRLFFQTRLKDYDGPAVVDFLKHLLRTIEQHIILVWDNATIHRSRAVKEFLRENADRIEAHHLPAYAFELMPVEGFNAQLKVHELKNAAYRDKHDLLARVRRKARSIQHRRKLCLSFWGQTPLDT